MASITYSGDFGGTTAGSNGKDITVTGTPLPSNAVITSINYSIRLTGNKYSKSYKWQLVWFAVGSTSGSPSASAASATMSSTEHTFTGSMSFSQSDVSKFTSGSFQLYAKVNNNGPSGYTSYMRAFSITINYSTPSLGNPGTPTITQNTNGTYTAKWTAATASGGSGNVTYRLYSVSDGAFISSASTSLTYTGTIGEYNYNCQYRVYAYYGSLSSYSSTASKTFYPPSLSTPTLTATINADTSLKLTWTAATLSYTTGNVAYSVYVGSNVYSSGLAATTITVPAATFEGWGTGNYVFKVVATATSLSNTSQGSTLSKTSGTYTYAYVAPVTAKTIAYYNGSTWVNCEVYYYNGSSWVLCEPHYYDGTKWVACSTV